MRFLSLFAGIGGFDLGLERAGMECVGQVENDPFCIKVLEKHWPNVKRLADIRGVKGDEFGPVNLVCGGFPCQPWSGAGKRRGTEDDRDLWPEMLRVIEIVRPRWVIGENVRNFVSMEMGLDRSISDLEAIGGYAVQAFVIPACAVDAPHRRDRVWVVARDTKSNGSSEERSVWQGENTKPRRVCEAVADTNPTGQPPSLGCGQGDREARDHAGRRSEDVADAKGEPKRPRLRKDGTKPNQRVKPSDSGGNVPNPDSGGRALWGDGQLPATSQVEGRGPDNGERAPEHEPRQRWLPEPDVGRVAHGVPQRVDRLKCLGNAVVPQVVERIGYAILKAEGVNEQNPLD
jgi:DNA (cytosine-5)-methyltransferase 1